MFWIGKLVNGVRLIKSHTNFKRFVKSNLPDQSELIIFKEGGSFAYGFIERKHTYVYFHLTKPKFYKFKISADLLIRLVGQEDYLDHFARLSSFKEMVGKLLLN